MKITALVKTNKGHEFVTAMIESIYDYVDSIVFINSNINWRNEFTGNTVKYEVYKWQKQYDKDRKIFHFECNVSSQQLQYNLGYFWAKKMFDPDWFMCIDTDEIWDDINIRNAIKYLQSANLYNSIGSNMFTYLKSPFYRVSNIEMCRPTVFVRPILDVLLGIRGNKLTPRLIPHDLFFHHFTYVRKYEKDVFNKIFTTLEGDRDDVKQTNLVNMDDWIKNKWNKLPRSKNLHTTLHFEESWEGVKKVKLIDLPKSLHNKKIIKEFNK